ncbi:hypothetical protein M409DRAFT_69101 [Zasmidium cellare ATCC 36951]|uniref:G-protein coupled receptors family 1 profile domain-containing protein n=1 Tax=Zasmidium cellare ATCC 36951 TaxID=1080233 RepID=A0A6A6C5Z5_ZASCE|nr:uncharacterized protein M409DRAFT_69101 [Zasmidium cellare ATCC 36951]KAF2162524.1 hypothetical protein M409DRAFT_69101 [Zasmidium cellare ATCC 36951]
MQTRAQLGSTTDFNASSILARQQQYQIQVIASTFSSVSILAAVCAIYWFCMMKRNFRRDLVLLLICGDLWKSFWFLVFSARTLSAGHIATKSSFCQASGYFLQVGLEACDVAIFLMSLHMLLQIFPPKDSFLGHDGLYRLRHAVMATWFVLPNIMSSLAFVNSGSAFISQGGFCSLPIRPFWYRLALSWIPRYLIWIFVMAVAIRIYMHVGYEFKVFGEERDRSSSLAGADSSNPNAQSAVSGPTTASMRHTESSSSDGAAAEKQAGQDDAIAPEDSGVPPMPAAYLALPGSSKQSIWKPARRQSTPNWSTPFTGAGLETDAFGGPTFPTSKSNPASRRGSRQIESGITAEDFAPPRPLPLTMDRPRGSVSTVGSMKSSGDHSYEQSPALAPIAEQKSAASTDSTPNNMASRAMKQRRKAIQRQLRLLFIYPVVYLILWIIPFVSHALNYSSHFAQHPIFTISALNIFYQTIMGCCDVLIFSWREKPWRHIPGSDGTFLGSFKFWSVIFNKNWRDQRRKSSAFGGDLTGDEKRNSSQSGLLNSLKRFSLSVTGKGNSPRRSEISLKTPSAPGAAPGPTTPSRVRAAPAMHRRTHSGGSDRRILAAERAQERLEMERRDYHQHRGSLNERRTNVMSQQEQPPPPAQTPRKEWWDRHMSVGGDDDLHEDDDGRE